MADTREKLTILNLEDAFEPKDAFSPYSLKSKWRVLPYRSPLHGEKEGKLVTAYGEKAPDITLSPKLEGWYKIYIYECGSSKTMIKLTSDKAFTATSSQYGHHSSLERYLWRCADMTGESITITKKKDGEPKKTILAGFEFVPMTDEEVAEWKREDERTDTKHLYVTDDMHEKLYYENMQSVEDWLSAVENYRHSDAEWVSLEQIRTFVSKRLPTTDLDDFHFPNYGDRLVQENFAKTDYDAVLRACVKRGHELGLKMSLSYRMGAWGIPYPYDQFYFDVDFVEEHPEFYIKDRNGDEMHMVSYAFPEVQDFVINELVHMAEMGCDAVTLISHRGCPYVLFEQPVADRYFAKYGEYPYELPVTDPRLNAIHCEIMTEFARRARKALDDAGYGKVEIHLRSHYSIVDTKQIAIDAEAWMKEGLITTVIAFPQRIYEKLNGDFWKQKTEHGECRIDLEKYDAYVKTHSGLVVRINNEATIPPYVDYKGDTIGPETNAEQISQWSALCKKYGVKLYIDIMPRSMPSEEYRRRALEAYANGADGLAFWDTYCRVPAKTRWRDISRLGHKDELATMPMNIETGVWEITRFSTIDTSRYNPAWGG